MVVLIILFVLSSCVSPKSVVSPEIEVILVEIYLTILNEIVYDIRSIRPLKFFVMISGCTTDSRSIG